MTLVYIFYLLLGNILVFIVTPLFYHVLAPTATPNAVKPSLVTDSSMSLKKKFISNRIKTIGQLFIQYPISGPFFIMKLQNP